MHLDTLRLERLTHRYHARGPVVLGPVSTDITAGVTALVGVNGAGKSTLLRILSTCLRPSEGIYHLDGPDGTVDPQRARRQIGFMPQGATIPATVRVADFLDYVHWMRGFSRQGRRQAVAIALEQVDLTAKARTEVSRLSGGMFRRLLLAQAILGEPRVVILDEPSAGLDPEQRVGLRRLLEGAAEGRIMLISSHAIEELAPITDRILMLDQGRLVYDGSPDDLEERGRAVLSPDSTVSPYEAAFLSLRGSASTC